MKSLSFGYLEASRAFAHEIITMKSKMKRLTANKQELFPVTLFPLIQSSKLQIKLPSESPLSVRPDELANFHMKLSLNYRAKQGELRSHQQP